MIPHEIQTALTHQITHANAIVTELSEVNGALQMLLHFLDTAHAQHLPGDSLHCLLAPVQAKLAHSLEQLDQVL